jgi:phage terminase small subunit
MARTFATNLLWSDGRKKGDGGLNDKQRRFAEEYVVDLNVTAAAKRAGYSERTAHVIGHKLLKIAKVAALVGKAQAKLSAKTEVNAERVINKLASIAFGETDPSLPKPADQLNALAQLGKHLGLFVERHEVDNRMSILSVNVSAQDLESARALVEGFRAEPKLIEGETIKDETR